MLFADIIGQEAVKKHLLQSANQGRVSHAQLFLGPEGSGNLALALAYAQYLNCTNKQADDSCGHCNNCSMNGKMAHPDMHYTYPTVTVNNKGKKSVEYITEWREAVRQNPYLNVFEWLQFIKAENKQGNITADECDEIVRKLSLTAYQGAFKILIIWMPEFLGKEGNKLLKIIEEPAPGTLFLLVAENADALLSTILSRTQLLRIPPLFTDDIAQFLIAHQQVEPDIASQIAAQAAGNYNAALHLLANANVNNREMLVNWVNICLSNNVPEFARFTDEMAEQGREIQKNFIGYCLLFFNQCLRFSILPANYLALQEHEKELCSRVAPLLNLNKLQSLITAFENADIHITRNANPRIVFFNLSIKISDLAKQAATVQ